jgi:hypothetical protein
MVLVEADGREGRPQGDLRLGVSLVLTMGDRLGHKMAVLIFYNWYVSLMFI